MDVADLSCVTTDPESTAFNGYSYAEDYVSTPPKTVVVLVRSNTNPTSPTDFSWSIISKIDSKNLAEPGENTNDVSLTFTISAQGVFAMFAQLKGSGSISYAIRYNPAGNMDPRFGYKGAGDWMNIVIDPAYKPSGKFRAQVSGYVSKGATSTLVPALLPLKGSTISLATVDDATHTLSPVAVWRAVMSGPRFEISLLDFYPSSSPTSGASASTPPCLTAFSLADIDTTMPAYKSFNTTGTEACYTSPSPIVCYNGDSLTLVYGQDSPPVTSSLIFTINDPNNAAWVGPPSIFSGNITAGIDYFVPTGNLANTSSFALLRRERTIYAFVNENGRRKRRIRERYQYL
ncbi:hypothetical protein BGZ97_004911 [Linnemannia gamsii]|uniref:Uncharacterized protein n=1 Tax=Linnemannia gamsii TaxID=64522 RepID=A0A9P6QW07_9FUNG|nr:hypothetical protein BGZ97_004911 [Linnemannia gamsii]